MKVLVVGASSGSGWATVQALLAKGHEVTAFARRAARLPALSRRLRLVEGDALRKGDLDRAVPGHDAVVVTLGISESALRVRLLRATHTPMDVRSTGTRHVIDAMQRHGLRRLVVQTSYGVGPTRDKLPWVHALIFTLLLKPQIADTEVQEQQVRASGLDWVIVQPVHLTDALEADPAVVSTDGEVAGMQVSRRQVGAFLAHATENVRELTGRTVALSGAVMPRSSAARATP